MKLRSVLLAATVLALPAAAFAQPVDGIYIGGGLGFDYLTKLDGKSLVIPAPIPNQTAQITNARLKSNGGFVGLASVGYGFGNGLRLEIEGNYRQNHVKVDNTAIVAGGGNFQEYGGFGNVLFDFDVGTPIVFPYVGLGVGYMENKFEKGNLYSTGAVFPNQPQVGINLTSSAKGSAAGQAILGAAWPFPGLPGLSITTEFRYVGQFSRQTFQGRTTVANSTGPGVVGTSVKFSQPQNASALIGLRYAFNVPTPPPPPAPVAAPAPVAQPTRTYLVFFDWDRADITARARQIIGEAAANAQKVQVTRIEVNGHADLSGTPAYNQRLSVRRAEAVAAVLVQDGIPRNEIFTQGFGDTHPLVPTARGVREPQNRRVEIILK